MRATTAPSERVRRIAPRLHEHTELRLHSESRQFLVTQIVDDLSYPASHWNRNQLTTGLGFYFSRLGELSRTAQCQIAGGEVKMRFLLTGLPGRSTPESAIFRTIQECTPFLAHVNGIIPKHSQISKRFVGWGPNAASGEDDSISTNGAILPVSQTHRRFSLYSASQQGRWVAHGQLRRGGEHERSTTLHCSLIGGSRRSSGPGRGQVATRKSSRCTDRVEWHRWKGVVGWRPGNGRATSAEQGGPQPRYRKCVAHWPVRTPRHRAHALHRHGVRLHNRALRQVQLPTMSCAEPRPRWFDFA